MSNPRKPTRLKIIEHTFRKDRAPSNEPEPELVARDPKSPSCLPADGARLWKRLAKELVDKRMLTVVDLPALEVACMSYAIYRQAFRAVTWNGRRTFAEYLRGRNSQTVPEFNAMMKALTAFRAFITEFGLTPAARSRLNVPQPPEGEAEMEKLWNARHG